MMIIMSDRHPQYHDDHCAHHHHLLRHCPHVVYIRLKCSFRAGLRRRRCVDILITMTAGDAEDAS